MSYHKARPEGRPDPTQPNAVTFANGRGVVPHAQIDGKPILGGLQNAAVEGVGRTPEEEKEAVKQYHETREATKKVAKETFDEKTGKPKAQVVTFEPDPDGDASTSEPASPEEVKKNVEEEKKADNTVEKKSDVAPNVGPKADKK